MFYLTKLICIELESFRMITYFNKFTRFSVAHYQKNIVLIEWNIK